MLVHHFPLIGLRLRTERLELRLPAPDELGELAALAGRGVHDPVVMPFVVPWTDGSPAEVGLSVVQHAWRLLGSWSPSDWELGLAVFEDGTVVGQQSVGARDFAVTRQVETGSWLGRGVHGQGVGTEMRAAVLHLAFAGLGAERAISAAFADNPASSAVSRKLGYRPDGEGLRAVRGRRVVERRLRLVREDWLRCRTVEVEVEGLEPCLPLFGLGGSG